MHPDHFVSRHIGPNNEDLARMLSVIGKPTLEALIEATVPADIRAHAPELPLPSHERDAQLELMAHASRNMCHKPFLGRGYHGTHTPAVIQRNLLENPGWYTQYTPYQAEISQGRLRSLLVYQTMVSDLTGLPIANASLLDEATAAAEAMHLCLQAKPGRTVFRVDNHCHPATIAVVRTRAEALGVTVVVEDLPRACASTCGVLVQYPGSDGLIRDPRPAIMAAHEAGALAAVACDLLALSMLESPGTLGADIALGNSQRFGVPLGFGGPHAAFFAVREEWKRIIPGRIVGVSKDRLGNPALRLSLQTREQHIRRERATSNICTAQALLANTAAMYAVYHGPEGLRAIARHVHGAARRLAGMLEQAGHAVARPFFDTLLVTVADADGVITSCQLASYHVRREDATTIAIALDETVTPADLSGLASAICNDVLVATGWEPKDPGTMARSTPFLSHPVFHQYRTEHGMLRLLKHIEAQDLSLCHGMIPLGSCTMKLNAASQMQPLSWPEWNSLHPDMPWVQARGYHRLIDDLERWLGAITGLTAVSLQPNAGSQGEYAGLLAIRAWQRGRGQKQRDICLIPVSAHGTNPASAVMVGLRVVAVACDDRGNIDTADLAAKVKEHEKQLCCLMLTYPSTHGVYEHGVREMCALIHKAGGQVYMDGANMNAQVGLTSPASIGADVCHLNLHKTFCIPHGGGGPGVGPICAGEHLRPYLPGQGSVGPVSGAMYGSASLLVIPWMYIRCMGSAGLTRATEVAILNANYIASRLKQAYPLLYVGPNGTVAHECILDIRPFKAISGIEAEDVAKRLMDYGFHAPTLSFPVAGTLMIEPTESEPLNELDRFCDAMLAIRAEIQAIAEGHADRTDNVLKLAPHTQAEVCADTWTHAYSRQQAAFPAPWSQERKFWPAVARVDSAHGDRNLICSCAGMEQYRP